MHFRPIALEPSWNDDQDLMAEMLVGVANDGEHKCCALVALDALLKCKLLWLVQRYVSWLEGCARHDHLHETLLKRLYHCVIELQRKAVTSRWRAMQLCVRQAIGRDNMWPHTPGERDIGEVNIGDKAWRRGSQDVPFETDILLFWAKELKFMPVSLHVLQAFYGELRLEEMPAGSVLYPSLVVSAEGVHPHNEEWHLDRVGVDGNVFQLLNTHAAANVGQARMAIHFRHGHYWAGAPVQGGAAPLISNARAFVAAIGCADAEGGAEPMLNPHINPLPPNTPHYLLINFADQLLARRLDASSQLALRAVCRGVSITVRPRPESSGIRLNLAQLQVLAQRGVQIYTVDIRGDYRGYVRMENHFAHVHQGTKQLTFNAHKVYSEFPDQPDYKTNFVRWMLLQRRMFPNLTSLMLKGVRMRDDVDLCSFRLTQLFLLERSLAHDPAYQLHQRVEAGRLQKLSLVRSGHILTMPSAFTGLVWLDLSEYQHWPSQGDLAWLTPLPGENLKTLKLQRCDGLCALDGLQQFRSLKSLDVRHNFHSGITWNEHAFQAGLSGCIDHITQCRATHGKLTRIQMQGCDYLPEIVEELPTQTLVDMDGVFPSDPNHQPGPDFNLVIRILDLLQQT